MAKKVEGYIKLQIPAGKATPAPPCLLYTSSNGVTIAFEPMFDKKQNYDRRFAGYAKLNSEGKLKVTFRVGYTLEPIFPFCNDSSNVSAVSLAAARLLIYFACIGFTRLPVSYTHLVPTELCPGKKIVSPPIFVI